MKQIFCFLSLVLFDYSVAAQLPPAIEIVESVPGDCFGGATNGIYVKYTGTVAPAITTANAGWVADMDCGCYNEVASSDVLTIFDFGISARLMVWFSTDGVVGNGCETATAVMIGSSLANNDKNNCVFGDFNGTDNGGAVPSCVITLNPTTPPPITPSVIPTLSEWGLVILCLVFLIFGIIGVRKTSTKFINQ